LFPFDNFPAWLAPQFLQTNPARLKAGQKETQQVNHMHWMWLPAALID
jgi:hypothetical protein